MTITYDNNDNTNNYDDDDDGGALTAVPITRDAVLIDGEPPMVKDGSAFTDGPKDYADAGLGDVAFVADDGDGNTSVMKPRKPKVHNMGVNTNKIKKKRTVSVVDGNNNINADDDSNDDSEYSDDNDTLTQYNASKWRIVAGVLFFLGSLVYVGMACMIMDTYWIQKDIPRTVYWADDDDVWWTYFVNGTDDGFVPEEVQNADDDYTWWQWYCGNLTESPWPDNDDVKKKNGDVWIPKIADEDAPGRESHVSKYMMLYFVASLGYICTSIIEVVLVRKYFWYMMLYILMLISACFGLCSAILSLKSPDWSRICAFISAQLWAIVALVQLIQRYRGGLNDADDYDNDEKILGYSIRKWFLVADGSFVFGTFGDLICSYLYISKFDNYIIGFVSIIFACGWLVCSIVYLVISIYDYVLYRKYYLYRQNEDKDGFVEEPLPETLMINNNDTGWKQRK